MNYKILGTIFILLFILGSTFAAAPTVSDLVLSNSYTNDRNYFSFPLDINAVATGDVNADSICWYQLTTGGSAYAATFDSDNNNCYVSGLTVAGGDDYNFAMIIQNDAQDANGTSPVLYTWRDDNAPSIAGVVTGGIYSKTLTITGTDVATNTGSGSGVATIYYKIGDGAWQSSTSNPLALNYTTTNSYTIQYYAIDELDNNGFAFLTSSTFTVQQAADADCTTIAWASLVITTLLCFVVINRFMAMSSTNSMGVNMMVSIAIAVIIGIVVITTFVGGVCVA